MKVLIVGGGGREHALAWKCAQPAYVNEVLVAPGNAGTARDAKLRNVDISADDIDGLEALAVDEAVDLTIVGPEAPLVAGIVDRFDARALPCFGPSAAAAELEGSKDFSKRFMQRHSIPTAGFATFTDVDAAQDYIKRRGAPLVVKADGLAAGKGVVVALTEAQALEAANDMLGEGRFGSAGQRVVIEDYLTGEEASFIVMTDGESVLPLASSQDHKARDDGDLGPNTGGMGAYSPAPIVTRELTERILKDVIHPTLRGLATENRRYRGFLYAGLMVDADGTPNVLEFNCRFGDPETQPIMMRLKTDLVGLCQATLDGRLDQASADWDERAAVGVVMAAGGYPGDYATGHIISGLDAADNETTKTFHAGTRLDGDAVLTAGGRVLCVVGLGQNVSSAQRTAYAGVDAIRWTDEYHRDDIGYRAIARE